MVWSSMYTGGVILTPQFLLCINKAAWLDELHARCAVCVALLAVKKCSLGLQKDALLIIFIHQKHALLSANL